MLCCAVLCLVSRIPELGREQREENKGSLLIFFSEALCLEHSARSAASQCWKPLSFQHTLVRLANKLQSNFDLFFFFGKREESTESEEVALISRKSFFLCFFFFFSYAAFQVFESQKMRMLEAGCGSCCALWGMIF